MKTEVESCKEKIYAQIASIISYRQKKNGCKEEKIGRCEELCSRYEYSPCQKYSRFENNEVFNVWNGNCYEQLNSRDYKIAINELIAFHINNEAKFTKIYREGSGVCFLMPADFKDNAMRTYFRTKFNQFNKSNDRKTDDTCNDILRVNIDISREDMDFSYEYSEKRRAELEYLIAKGIVARSDIEGKTDTLCSSSEKRSKYESWKVTDGVSTGTRGARKVDEFSFDAEVKRARKDYLDARNVCIIEWELRSSTEEVLEKLVVTIKKAFTREHTDCHCNKDSPICEKLLEPAYHYLESLVHANKNIDGGQQVSQLLDYIQVQVYGTCQRLRGCTLFGKSEEVDEKDVVDCIDDLLNFYLKLGTHDTSLFYEKNRVYEDLKTRHHRICCVCGIRTLLPEKSSGLKDAVSFKELLVVEEEELAEWKALMSDDEDILGALAQKCFHIAEVENDNCYYHILHIDDPNQDNSLERNCCLISDGKLLKLPACEECYNRLRKATMFLKKKTKKSDPTESSNYKKSDRKRLSKLDKAIRMLKHLCFKRCDLGRIPKCIPKLSNCGRTAIAPFIAYTIIRQLRCSKYLPGSAQHTAKRSTFSIPSEDVNGKEFVIPLLHDEFINSFENNLPREDVATRHRVLFLGKDKAWKSMESTLNRQNRGQDFDVVQCYNLLKLLKKTKALSSDFTVKRKGSLGMLQRKVELEMSQITRTTDSSSGVILESSERVHQMDNACRDDVAAARLLSEKDGTKTASPGISSSLFYNKASQNSKLPLLNSMLNSLPGKQRMSTDPLLLKIKRELPNEFANFSQITTHTFPDLFPIPLKDNETNPINFRSVSVRRHLLDYYDSRFCNKMFIFWMFGILTRHKSVFETCAFFKRNTDARRKYERMCNNPDLEDKLERAIKNPDSREAKKLNEKFSGLLRIVGGNTPWSTMERQSTLGKLYAMCGFFGLPSIFVTLAPCIADSQICINLCSNINFEYSMKESTHQERSRWTAANPVASAKAFRLIIDTVVQTFIGIPTGNLRKSTFTDIGNVNTSSCGGDDTLLADTFEKHLQSRRGFMGVAQAFYGIFEPQGRAALHLHGLLWTLISSELIARCSKRQLEHLCIAIDRVITTWIHKNDVKDEEEEKKCAQINPRCALRQVPKDMNIWKLGSFSKRIMYRVQFHGKCSYTCFKSKKFRDRCRLAKPSEECPKTVALVLRENRALSGEILMPIKCAIIDPPPELGNLGIPVPDSRVHWIDHKRLNAVDANMVDGNIFLSAALG